MKYPGQNKIILTEDAIKQMVARSLNYSQPSRHGVIYVTDARRSGYGGDVEFTITTDAPPTVDIVINNQPTTKEL